MESPNVLINATSPKSKPMSLVCYICGREFGTKSLKIHLKTCAQKWEWEESKKPQKDRRPLPKSPADLEELLQKETIEWEQMTSYNTQASETFNNEGLVKCEFCNRTFFDHKMAGHRKICTKERPVNPLPNKFQTSSDFKERNRCKSTPRYHEAEDTDLDTSQIDKKPAAIKLKRIKEIQVQGNRDSIIYEAQSEDLEDNHMKITDAFIIPSTPTNETTSMNNSNDKKEELPTNNKPTPIPLDRKYTESFVKKVRVDKKRGSKAEAGSPKIKPKTQGEQKSANINPETRTSEKNTDSPLKQEKEKNFEKATEARKGDSYEKKEQETTETRPKNKSVMKATESFLNKMAPDNRKKSAINVLDNYSKKGEGKKESGANNDESLSFMEERKKRESIKDEIDLGKYAKRKYKLFTPVKTLDFNY